MTSIPIQSSAGIHIDRPLPGDKSISHRAAMIASLSEGDSVLRNLSTGMDVVSTLNCLKGLGVVTNVSGDAIKIRGRGLFGLTQPDGLLDCGNSGTTARLLSGILAGQKFDSVLTGDASLSCRPMNRIAIPMREMGANIKLSENGSLPMQITGSKLHGITYHLDVPSAQVKSCLLLAGMHAQKETVILESIPTRDHTERLLPFIKKDFKNGMVKLILKGNSYVPPLNMDIPGDFSSAAFLIAAAILIPRSDIRLLRVGLNPTRTGFLDVLKKMGVGAAIENRVEDTVEPYGDIVVAHNEKPLRGCLLERNMIPNIIDEIPVLAVLGTQTDSGLKIRNASELRKKECDRISAIVYNLRQMGAEVEEYDDGFFVQPCPLRPAQFKTFGDHRIAMAFAVAAMAAEGESSLDDSECITISFPEFFEYCGIKINHDRYELSAC